MDILKEKHSICVQHWYHLPQKFNWFMLSYVSTIISPTNSHVPCSPLDYISMQVFHFKTVPRSCAGMNEHHHLNSRCHWAKSSAAPPLLSGSNPWLSHLADREDESLLITLISSSSLDELGVNHSYQLPQQNPAADLLPSVTHSCLTSGWQSSLNLTWDSFQVKSEKWMQHIL